MIFLSKWVICRFHVNLPGCTLNKRGIFFSLLTCLTNQPIPTSRDTGGSHLPPAPLQVLHRRRAPGEETRPKKHGSID